MDNITHALDIAWRMIHEFASSADTRRSIHRGLDYARRAVAAEAASFFHLNKDATQLTCIACQGPVDITDKTVPVNTGMIGICTQNRQSRLIADTNTTDEVSNMIDTQSGFKTRSMICVPVADKDSCHGAIQLINRDGGGGYFDHDDLALAEVLANATALALTNSRLTQDMLANAALRRDLDMAARVQENLLPAYFDNCIYGANIPRNTVSGDLFDYIRHNMYLYFCMGDVAGKGIDAALIMAKTHSLFRVLARNHQNPAQLMAAINRELLATSADGRFVTLVIGILNCANGHLQLCNGGHEPSFILNDNNRPAQMMPATMPPLAIIPMMAQDIHCYETQLQPDARLYCYSDGIREAKFNNKELGTNGLIDFMQKHMQMPLATQIDHVIAHIKKNADYVRDDLTLLGMEHII